MNFLDSTEFEHSEVLDEAAPVTDYRTFRQRRFAREAFKHGEAQTYYGGDDHVAAAHPLSLAKAHLKAARVTLAWDLNRHPERFVQTRRHAMRMLGIPPSLDQPRIWWKSFGYSLLDIALPYEVSFAWLRRYLGQVRSFEGRKLIMDGPLHAWVGREYREGLDFVIRDLRGPVQSERLKDLEFRSPAWMATLHRLGCTTAVDLAAKTRESIEHDIRVLVRVLHRNGVLMTLDELNAWPGLNRRGYVTHGGNTDWEDCLERSAEAVVRRLLAVGAERHAILKACQSQGQFMPGQLTDTIIELQCRGVSPAQVLEVVGNQLWTSRTDRWRFLMDELHVREPSDFGLFRELLSSRGDLPAELARTLRADGGSVADLAACQSVLLSAGKDAPVAAVRTWQVLSRAPFAFAVTDFAKVREYLRRPDALPDFLEVLSRHGLTSPEAVLAFDECFASVEIGSFGSLLSIALPRRGQESLASVADWVRRAHMVGSYNACITLVELLDIPQLSDLERALKLLPITAGVLRYLVQDKRLSSLSELLSWFQKRANGILEMKLHGKVGAIERLLLDDGFKRANFLSVRHNVDCAIGALRQRAQAQLGPRPNTVSAQARDTYDAQCNVLQATLTPALLADMKRLLEATSGVLFESFLVEVDADPAAFERRLAAISPLIDELVSGRGPRQDSPSESEIEAVGVVYGVDPRTVSEFWPDVVDREADIAGLKLASHYPMRWKQTRRELRAGARLDDRGFSALSKIAGLAAEFNRLSDSDMERARVGLRPSRIADDAADVPGLASHLAVVCGLLAADSNVSAMLGRWESAHGAIAGGQAALELIEQTQSFFGTSLVDAYTQHLSDRLERMGDNAARQLAERLAPDTEELRGKPAREHLQHSVQVVCTKLATVYGAWASRQKAMFASIKDGHADSELIAVVSKTPAAFFAKFAAALCTKADTDMWNEERHSHLVVFDPVKRRLVGMAMLYVEDVAAIATDRQTLVIRAMNPMIAVATEHEPASMVDSFLAVAIEIARTNGLAAVAVPGGDAHQLSNVKAVESAVCERCIESSTSSSWSWEAAASGGDVVPPWTVATTFDGCAKGNGRVSALHVIWRHPE